MRAVAGSLFVLGATALCAATSSAAVVPFTGQLSISTMGPVIQTPQASLPLIGVSGSGVATVDGSHISTLEVPASSFDGRTVLNLPTSLAPPALGLALTVHNGVGSFAATGMGGLGGQMPLNGVLKICIGIACTRTPPANINVPL